MEAQLVATGHLVCQEDWPVRAWCCVKVVWETVYTKRSVCCMSGDMHVTGCVCVCVAVVYMSNS